MTVRRRLEEMGFQRQRATPPSRQSEPERRYGYQPDHRRQPPEQRYPSSLTDEEWCIGAVSPSRYSTSLLSASVVAYFRRCSQQSKFEQMHDRLRAMAGT